MLTFDLKSLRIDFTFGFFFIVALTTLSYNRLGVLSLLFCIVHEFGHLFMMCLFGVKLHALRFYGAGIKITTDPADTLPRPLTALIYLAGPLANLLLASFLTDDACALNIAIAIFNLLPISYFDGGKLVSLAIKNRGVLCFLSATSYIMLTALTVISTVNNPAALNPSSLLTMVFVALACIFDG